MSHPSPEEECREYKHLRCYLTHIFFTRPASAAFPQTPLAGTVVVGR